ncbi:MAG: tetratricopeptide repeat protein [Candidatus Zixiibacteriota bacterium]|nr:MAG: tetratricopeptide repeat protein [candidate division Zixibacteria bacterium]
MPPRTCITFVFLTLFVLASTAGQAETLKTPVENSPDVIALIDHGISLHDAGKYKEAIEKYKEAVKLNPDNPTAYYEIAMSYFALQDYKAAHKYAEKAAEFHQGSAIFVYVLLGNTADMIGKPEDAIEAYDRGLRLQPNNYLLLYNKGYLYTRQSESGKAIECYKKAVSVNPNHPSSHAALAQEYERQNYHIPCILAYCRFFALEPNTRRAAQLLPAFQRLLTLGVEKQSDSVINVDVSMSAPDFDGDFTGVNLLLALSAASRHIDDNKDKPPVELIYEDLNSIFSMMDVDDSTKEHTGFVWEYYAPYFGEMYRREYVRAFVYHMFQLSEDRAIQSWLTENEEQVNDFLIWSTEYEFKSGD